MHVAFRAEIRGKPVKTEANSSAFFTHTAKGYVAPRGQEKPAFSREGGRIHDIWHSSPRVQRKYFRVRLTRMAPRK